MNMSSPATRSGGKGIIIVLVVALLAIGAYAFTHMQDNRTTGERLDDAGTKLSNGDIGGAADQLGDRTPGQKVGDAMENAGEKIQQETK